jgi:uncharacterized membrane protein (GlpM family)
MSEDRQDPGAEPSRVKRSSLKDYAIRFLFGGIITAAVGIVGAAFGPVIAGLFLAFPAILPASVTLIQKHEDRDAAAADAVGAADGSLGLIAFGAVVWGLATRSPAPVVLSVAMVAWLVASLVLWWLAQHARHVVSE